MRLTDANKKFRSDLDECWMELVEQLQQMDLDYHLSQSQKLQYMQNFLSKDAKRLYMDHVQH